ncbi:MAG: preprotein translocase subunit SecA, partial [[Clostridium] leptum]
KERKKAYDADITYGTNNELGFDYLRDNMVTYKENKVQREHVFAIVDEVDSILIDEARTPLIISGQGDKSTELYTLADRFARTLKETRVAELNEKEDNDELYKDADYIVDEKAKTATLTPSGVKKAEAYFNIDNLTDADNITIQHHINQAIKAHGVMKRDIEYVVKDGEVIIVDEFTGRLMYGRRYNEGLHQAIEAKEGVTVARESKTLATITFQNYFRLYKRLSGMTGTAMTEEEEFREIYKLDVVEIPTNRPMIRKDLPDSIFRTEKGKFEAVIEDIIQCHEKGQPVLVGTISIEKSELLSKMLKRRGIKHEVLNAKYHDKEAEIVAQAGKKGAVTIATNMAGRGTDIMLGGNAEYMAKAEMRRMQVPEELIVEATGFAETDNEDILNARRTFQELNKKYKDAIKSEAEEVREAGGLFIMGTERHESRRIDNQLRGRSGRQGDPGTSRFYLSVEDDLMRLFGGDRMKAIMDRLNVEENVPIENKVLSNSIESAQRKVESRNFGIRKNVLQYDDVMNRQREIIYAQRNEVLDGKDLKEQILKMLRQAVESRVKTYLPAETPKEDWNLEGLRDYYRGWLLGPDELQFTPSEVENLEADYVIDEIYKKAEAIYENREKVFGSPLMRELERVVLLKNVDTKWMDHIDAMEELKRGIRLRAYAQHDPVVEYRLEGFDMFDEMIAAIREDTARMMLTLRLQVQRAPAREPAAAANSGAPGAGAAAAQPQDAAGTGGQDSQPQTPVPPPAPARYIAPKREQVAKPTSTSGGSDGSDSAGKTVRKGKKVGRNDPCPCGSGKKYKKCCGRDE